MKINPLRRTGLTLVEVMVSLVILTILATAISKSLIYAQYSAEDNLHESIALNMALSTLEQLKAENYNRLLEIQTNGNFDFIYGNGNSINLTLNTDNVVPVPVGANDSGVQKNLELTLKPSITDMATNSRLIQIDYSYMDPRDRTVNSRVIRSVRGKIEKL